MKHLTYYNLIEALKEKGCPICTLLGRNTHKYMVSFLYESVNDPGVRKRIRESYGFCSRHAWQLKEIGDGLGLSIVYEDLLENTRMKIESMVQSVRSIKDLKTDPFVSGTKSYTRSIEKSCPVCRLEKQNSERNIAAFLESLEDSEFKKLYMQSSGLCMPHLIELLRHIKHIKNEEKQVREILHTELRKIRELSMELKEFQRKHDYRFSSEGFGPERDSWIRAIEKMAGKEGNGSV